MSKEVEQRVVEMRFDNKNFEKNVADTMSTLDKLKEKLNFRGIERSFDGISSSARNVNMSPISGAVDTVIAKFSAFDAITFSVLQNLTNRAISAGEQLVKSLTLDQISEGWKKYETEVKAVQTIMNAKPELSIEDVEKQLARLSWFTDETSYSYSDMIDAIGQFTSYGIELDDAVTAMEGIANWAAASGQGINEARSAMRNLSQAMASNVIQWKDWMSVSQTAHMSTEEFKTVAIETAKSMGLLDKQGKTVKGTLVDVASFDSTLADKWFTGDVLMATLKKYGAYTDKVYDYIQEIDDASISCADAMERVSDAGMELSSKAFKAGQEAKTLTDALGSIKDASSSIWKDIFKSIFGNYETSKKLWTNLTNDLWDIFVADISDIRDVIKEWGDDGGREDVFAAISNSLAGLKSVLDVVRTAFKNVFPPITTETLKKFSTNLKKFSEKLILSEEKADKLQRTLQGLFAILDIVRIVITDAAQIGLTIFNTLLGKSTDKIGDITANMGDSIVSFRDWIKEHDHSVESIKKVCDKIATVRTAIKNWVDDHINLRESLSKLREHIQNGMEKIEAFGKKIWELPAVQTAVTKTKDILAKFFDKAKEFFSDGYDRIKEFIEHLKTLDGFSFENIKDALKSFKDIVLDHFFNIEGGVDKLKSTFGTLKDSITGNFKKAGDSMDSFRDKIANFGKLVKDKAEAATDFSLKWATTSHNLKTYATNAKKKLKEIVDVGDLLSIALGGTLIVSIKNISDAFKTLNGFLKTFTNPLDALTGVFKGLQEIEKAYAKKVSVDAMTKMIKGIAVAIGVLVGVVYVLAKLSEKGTMWDGIYGLIALSTALTLMVAAFAAINKFLGSLKIDIGIQASVLAIAAAVAILVGAIKVLDTVDPDNIWRNVAVIGILAGGLTFLSVVISKCVKEVSVSSVFMIAIAAALYIMVAALVKLNDLDTSHIVKKLLMLSTAMKYLALIMVLSKGVGVGGALAILAVGIALGQIVKVFDKVGKMDTSGIVKNLWVLILAFDMLAAIMTVSAVAGKNAAKGGLGVLAMSAAVFILIKAMKQIAEMPVKDLLKGLTVVSVLMLVFSYVVALSHFAGENAAKAGVMILLMSGALLIIAGVITIFAKMPEKDLWKAVGAVAVLEILFGGLIAVSKLAGDAKNTMIGMSIAIAVLAVSLIALSFIEWDRLLPAAGALTLVMGAFAAMTAATGQVKKAMGTIIVLAIVVAELAAILYVLSGLPWESTLASAGAMSMLILALSGAMFILGKSDSINEGIMMKMAILAGIVAGLAAILGVLNRFDLRVSIEQAISLGLLIDAMAIAALILGKVKTIPDSAMDAFTRITGAVGVLAIILGVLDRLDMNASISQAIALGILVNAIAASTLILDHVGEVSDSALAAFGKITIAVGLLGGILTILHNFDFNTSIEEAASLSILLLAMAGVTAILSKIGKGSLSAAAEGAAALDVVTAIIFALVAVLGAALTGIGALFEKYPNLEDDLDRGIAVITKVTAALGEFVGSFVGHIVSSALPEIGTGLSEFMDNLQPFFEGAKQASGPALDGVKNLVKIILLISAANVIEGIARWLTGEKSMMTFVESLNELAPALKKYSEEITKDGGINAKAIEDSANAAKVIVEMANMISRTGGLLQKLIGIKDLTKFAADLQEFAPAIKAYSDEITKDGGLNTKAIEASATASKTLVELVNTLPSTGGRWQEIVGVKDLTKFANDLIAFAPAIKGYSDAITKDGGINKKAIENSATAAKALSELENTLPPSDGVLQDWIGEKSLSSFAKDLELFGPSIKAYSDAITEGDGISTEAITASTNAATTLVELSHILPETGGVWGFFTGEKDLGAFGTSLVTFGESMAAYAMKVKGINAESVTASANAARMLAATAAAVEENNIDKSTFDGFGTAITTLSTKMETFYTSMQDVDPTKLSTAISHVKKLIEMGKGITGIDTDSMKKFGDSLKKMAKDGVDGFIKAFSDAKSRVETAAKSILSNFITGLDAKKGDVDTDFSGIVSSAITAITSSYGDFQNAGKYVVEGFASGIENNSYIAENAARTAAAKALEAAQQRLDENSPSKEFYKVGHFAVLGMANAMRDGGSLAYDAGYGMADNAVSGLRKAIANVSDMVENDIDTQPTIRPVLDLSDVSTKASQLNAMLSRSQAMSISASMNRDSIIQNGNPSSESTKPVYATKEDVEGLRQEMKAMNSRLETGIRVNIANDREFEREVRRCTV